MNVILYRYCTCRLFLIIGIIVFCQNYFLAQDTIALKEVDIITKKITLSQIGKKTETIDSTLKQQFKFNSIADVLSLQSTVFIKSYGPGALATTAFRGGNASQTAILWNGFNIQNAMLGQLDLNLLPNILFDNVEVEYGGSSGNWGSGAVAGSIHLNNSLKFNKGLFTSINTSSGNFGLFNASTQVNYSKKRFISSTKLFTNSSKNNFNYKDTSDKENPVKQQQHAAYKFYGLLQEFKFLLNSKQILNVNAWLNINNRELPTVNKTNVSKQYQYDESTRITANWSYFANKYNSSIKAALFNTKLNYTDSVAAIFSKSKVQTVIVENEHFYKWYTNQQLNVGVNATSNTAITQNYQATKSLTNLSLLFGNKGEYLKNKLLIYSQIRLEYYKINTTPITGNISATYFLLKNITCKLNVAKIFRMPTLNELYWQPGGNLNLKPEQGYTYEGELNYTKQINSNFLVSVSGAVFNRTINDWILWTPGANQNPQPLNIQKVWSRGSETTWKLQFQKNKFKAILNTATGYVLSTIQSNYQENNSSENKQLVYTPRYTVNTNFSIAYDNLILTYYHQYIGYRFTTSDNTNWLNPYHYSSLRFNSVLKLNQSALVIYASCNNLLNKNYTILSAQPMPLRNFEVGISLQYKKGT